MSEAQRDILTIDEAAELLGVSVKTFNKVLHSENIPARKIGRLYRLLYGRAASADELALGQEYVTAGTVPAAWDRYAHALMLANEFVMVD